ncbi:MerR family DNA-binding transcriptional regulator, partial [Pseudomonas sp. BGM005]|nr:MerR family DNA-binding transcriptional regulator [Pseudomonas sp. BG5]
MREDSQQSADHPELAIGQVAARLGISAKILRRLADQGAIPSNRTEGGHRRFILRDVEAALNRVSSAPRIARSTPPDWRASLDLEELDEAAVWSRATTALALEPSDSTRLMNYAFTEMLNNAIDHSRGSRVD